MTHTSGATGLPAGMDAPQQVHARVPRVALVGVHGYGERHLANLARLQKGGAVELVAVADPHPPAPGALPGSASVFASLAELLAAGLAPDVVILATPIQTHAALSLAALASGADVYVEKPPVASLAQFQEVLAAAEAAGRLVQVGFQSLGSQALPAIKNLMDSGSLGTVLGVTATGQWLRTKGYFGRSRWAGKRSINGVDVVDGVCTNALAHAVATALHIAGAHTLADVVSVETDLYRAHATQSDDTSVLRIRTAAGRTLVCALTLCAPEQENPSVTVHGTEGQATFYYTQDELVITAQDGERRQVFGRFDLLENLLSARANGTELLSSLEHAGAFTAVLESIRTAPDPQEIGSQYVTWEGDGDLAHPVVHGISDLIKRSALSLATFSELGAPWARPLPPTHVLELPAVPRGVSATSTATPETKQLRVAEYLDGSHVRHTSSPRPYLHPVRTLAGTVVTDHQPADHVWHLGVGVALQDVDGINFWGGRTYTRDAGAYVWRPDHGSIRRTSIHEDGATLRETLAWSGPDGADVLHEDRLWSWRALSPSAWQLTLDFTLRPATEKAVHLGSPGTHGRHEGGYGGFFWRLPENPDATVWTESASGEENVHGSTAPWLAWSGTFSEGSATLVYVAAEESTDPWFVRVSGYPGVGQSLAWERPVITSSEAPVHRSVSVVIADGILGTAEIQQVLSDRKETR